MGAVDNLTCVGIKHKGGGGGSVDILRSVLWGLQRKAEGGGGAVDNLTRVVLWGLQRRAEGKGGGGGGEGG